MSKPQQSIDADDIYTEPEIISQIGISKTFNLTDSDKEHRGESFLDEKTLRFGGIRRVSEDTANQILVIDRPQKDKEYHGLAIPYFNVWNSNKIIEFEIRRDKPDYEKTGNGELKEKRKYLKPRTSKNLLYIPPMVKAEWLADKKKKIIIITEGAFKALALARIASNDWTSDKWHFIPLAISGVDNYKTKATITQPNGAKVSASVGLPEFEQIEWKGAKVIICFDSDADKKPNVKFARNRINHFFREKNIKTFNLDLPKDFEGIATKGIDDYLGAIEKNHNVKTAIDAALELVENAQKPKKVKTPIADNFELIENGMGENPGVYFTDENGESFKVCSPLKIVAETQTETGENYGRLLEWKDSQNRLHRWAMPIEFVHSQGAELAKYLASNGLEIMPSRKHHEKIAFYIATSQAEKVIISTDKIGWHNECFILPNETFGESENEIVYQTEYDGHHNFKTSGTLTEWQENISIYCKNNSRLLFAVSTAFAAPLLPIVQIQGGGFHFRGSTSTGKTTALLVAGSVWGGDSEHGFSQTWKATANGLEVIAAGHNHALLCLDEIGECETREVGNVAYMLPNGRGKLRMAKTLQARHSLTWNLLFLSTGEQSLADKITESGGIIKGGQEIRLCDIEADTGKFGLFENLHDFPSGQAFSDHLRASSCQYYGNPIREFLTWLTEIDLSDIRERWHSFKDNFINDVLPEKEKVPSEVFRVAARFALVALGGELATEADITKWQPGEAYEAAKTVFHQWMDGRIGHGQSDVERGIIRVADFLNSNESRFYKSNPPITINSTTVFDNQRVPNAAGYIRKNTYDKTEYLIFPSVFQKEICKGLDYRKIQSALFEKKCLVGDAAGKFTTNCKIDGKQQRYYVITQKIFELADEKENENEVIKSANV